MNTTDTNPDGSMSWCNAERKFGPRTFSCDLPGGHSGNHHASMRDTWDDVAIEATWPERSSPVTRYTVRWGRQHEQSLEFPTLTGALKHFSAFVTDPLTRGYGGPQLLGDGADDQGDGLTFDERDLVETLRDGILNSHAYAPVQETAEDIAAILEAADRIREKSLVAPEQMADFMSRWEDQHWASLSLCAGRRPASASARTQIIAAFAARKSA